MISGDGGKIIEKNEFRKGMYLLLSRVYGEEPDRMLLEDLADAAASSKEDDRRTTSGGGDLNACLKSLSFDQKGLDHLGAEFAELFLGAGKQPVHPYESVHMEEAGILMGVATIDVRNAYRRQGFMTTPCHKEPDDHVAIEFEFMAVMCHKMNQHLMNDHIPEAVVNRSDQADFFNRHIVGWVPDFCLSVVRNSKPLSFYASMAKITISFITSEKCMIGKGFP
jgi:putative dimethyl sulfoxide reductase chaperone